MSTAKLVPLGRTIPKVGTKVYTPDHKRPYTVRAASRRFAVCTKPFNARRTVIYFVLDTVRYVRGTENLVFGMGAESDQDCAEMLARLESGETEVSYRNVVPWDVLVESGSAT